jgi:hypothetical protein
MKSFRLVYYISRIAIFCSLGFWLSACAHRPKERTTGYRGRVIDVQTGRPISGLHIGLYEEPHRPLTDLLTLTLRPTRTVDMSTTGLSGEFEVGRGMLVDENIVYVGVGATVLPPLGSPAPGPLRKRKHELPAGVYVPGVGEDNLTIRVKDRQAKPLWWDRVAKTKPYY